MPKLAPTLALVLLVQTAAAQTLCVRRNAELLEPSGDPPQDVARAAAFLCMREETAALNAGYRASAGPRSALRDTALFHGAAQATVARACRVAQRCGLAPLPNPN